MTETVVKKPLRKKLTIKSTTTTKPVRKRVVVKEIVPKTPIKAVMSDWETMMRVIIPAGTNRNAGRPRRSSLHTIATMCGRTDVIALAKEMEKSGKVVGYRCPDVQCLIFYLKDMTGFPGMIDSRHDGVWGQVAPFLLERPFPQVRGFKRFAEAGSWSGGSYGRGTYVPNPMGSGMVEPFESEDYAYARAIGRALRDSGYTPGYEPPEDESIHDECCGGKCGIIL